MALTFDAAIASSEGFQRLGGADVAVADAVSECGCVSAPGLHVRYQSIRAAGRGPALGDDVALHLGCARGDRIGRGGEIVGGESPIERGVRASRGQSAISRAHHAERSDREARLQLGGGSGDRCLGVRDKGLALHPGDAIGKDAPNGELDPQLGEPGVHLGAVVRRPPDRGVAGVVDLIVEQGLGEDDALDAGAFRSQSVVVATYQPRFQFAEQIVAARARCRRTPR